MVHLIQKSRTASVCCENQTKSTPFRQNNNVVILYRRYPTSKRW